MMITTLDNYSYDNVNLPKYNTETTIQVYFDGLCQPRNPGGIACYAFLIKEQENTIYSEYGLAAKPFTVNATNNVAEYSAIIKALEWLIANGHQNQSIAVKGDSQLVFSQINRKFKVKAAKIIPLYRKVMSLISKFNNIQIEWIPREQNKEADKLSNYAYAEAIANNPSLMNKNNDGDDAT
jgi:ribonuclease HI